MRVVAGNCRGTGAVLNVCIGFVPDWVKILNYDDDAALSPYAHWNKYFSTDAEIEGYGGTWDAALLALYTQAGGIQPYYGGVLMDSTTQPSVVYGHANVDCVTWDDRDYRYKTGEGPHSLADSAGDTIDTWSTDTAASYTGSFNADSTGTYIGIGSEICIDNDWYHIVTFSTSSATADAVELNLVPTRPGGRTLTSARISKITGKYGTCGFPIARNDYTKPGFKMAAMANVNVSGEMFMFEAGTYDN